MIPKFAIEQASKSYMNASKKEWETLIEGITALFKTYETADLNAARSRDSAKLTARRTKDNAIRGAWGTFKQTTESTGGNAWATYQEAETRANSTCESDIEHADNSFNDADRVNEENWHNGKVALLKEYQEGMERALAAYKEALP